MDVTPIKTDADFRAALAEIERLWDVEPDTPEGDRLDVLMTLVEAYERRNHPMPPADPIAAIEFMMEQRGMTRADLEPIIGSSGRVSEVLNRRRALSVSMIRRLSEALQIPPEILIRPYDLQRAA
ncbi:helix-turn-helix domain-containing protein [Azospirillum brasilense]|uniref:helix-turn-helix domain-containing protein n=1 Tax=Azospirillum argentinense TaxID=2970906 RepID=UPI00190D7951|nr:helix-turn-helix domain-containing protein [Azospirillum argentinense]MBK3799696.1 helix-turn-helix domain-containing protein [Azospirillum argentinense]